MVCSYDAVPSGDSTLSSDYVGEIHQELGHFDAAETLFAQEIHLLTLLISMTHLYDPYCVMARCA